MLEHKLDPRHAIKGIIGEIGNIRIEFVDSMIILEQY